MKQARTARARGVSFLVDTSAMSASLDRAFRRRGVRRLYAIQRAFQVNARELGELFGVTRQAVDQWMQRGVPAERFADVDRVAELAGELSNTFKRDRLPSIVRAPLPGLENASILDTIRIRGTARAFELVDRLHSWAP